MTDRQLEALRYTLWAELQLPEAPVFVPGARGVLTSQTFTMTAGFMAKFVESYVICVSEHPAHHADSPWSTGVRVHISYQHGKWEGVGANGVTTNLFFHREQQRWVDQNTAREMIYAERQGA